MWFVSNGIIECHIENLQIEIGNRTPNCLRHHVWLDVSTFNKCLFTTKQRGFLLILICETSQIFVWRNKAFIFFQKSDIKLNKRGAKRGRNPTEARKKTPTAPQQVGANHNVVPRDRGHRRQTAKARQQNRGKRRRKGRVATSNSV